MTGSIWRATVSLFLLLILWQLISVAGVMPASVLPSPAAVGSTIASQHRVLIFHSWATLRAVGLGFCVGGILAFLVGVLSGRVKLVRDWLLPPLVLTQVVPKIALAPLLLLWFGTGLTGKAVLTGLIAFFPILLNTAVGVREIDPGFVDLFKSIRASPFQELWLLRIPNALPYVFEAARLSFVYSVVGAITAEFLRPGEGLGHLIIVAESSFNMRLLFAAVVASSCLGLLGWFTFGLLHRLVGEYSLQHPTPDR